MNRPPTDTRHIYTDEEYLDAEPRLSLRIALTLSKGACNLIMIVGVIMLIVAMACAVTHTPLEEAIHVFSGGRL